MITDEQFALFEAANFHESQVGQDFRERYDLVCPVCRNETEIAPSLAMRCGMNQGAASCPGCKTFLLIRIADTGDHAEAVPYQQYIEVRTQKAGASE